MSELEQKYQTSATKVSEEWAGIVRGRWTGKRNSEREKPPESNVCGRSGNKWSNRGERERKRDMAKRRDVCRETEKGGEGWGEQGRKKIEMGEGEREKERKAEGDQSRWVRARPCSLRHDYSACSQGLKASLAAELLLRDGPNALRPPRGTPEYVKFTRQLAGGLQCLMWVAAAICLIAFAIQASEGDLTTDDNVSGG